MRTRALSGAGLLFIIYIATGPRLGNAGSPYLAVRDLFFALGSPKQLLAAPKNFTWTDVKKTCALSWLECDISAKAIVHLDVARRGLTGGLHRVTPYLLQLSSTLRVLRINNNNFTGTLPPEWSALTALTVLDVGANKLRGTLPASWSKLTALQHMGVGECGLTGTVPEQWSALKNLRIMYLTYNNLAGTLPKQWSRLTNAVQLSFHNNSFTGSLPGEWSSMTKINYLWVFNTKMTGTLPTSYKGLSRLNLYVGNSAICGPIPSNYLPKVFSFPNQRYSSPKCK